GRSVLAVGCGRRTLGVRLMIYRVATALFTTLLLIATLTRTGQAASLFDDSGPGGGSTTPPTANSPSPLTITTYAGGSRVLEEPLYSPTLNIHTSFRVLLPADYDAGTRRYPVLYMLHGVAG